MEELFRFMVVRAPDASTDWPTIELTDPATSDPGGELPDVIEAGLAISSEDGVAIAAELREFEALLEAAVAGDTDKLAGDVKDLFNDDAATVTASEEWQKLAMGLDFGILAGKSQEGQARDNLEDLARYRRLMGAIEAMAADPQVEVPYLQRFPEANFTVPEGVFDGGDREPPEDESKADFQKEKAAAFEKAAGILNRYEGLSEARSQLEALSPNQLEVATHEAPQPTSTQNREQADGLIQRGLRWFGFMEPLGEDTIARPLPGLANLTVKEEGLEQLSEKARDALEAAGIDPTKQPIEQVMSDIARRQMSAKLEAKAALGPFTTRETAVTIGGSVATSSKPIRRPSAWAKEIGLAPMIYAGIYDLPPEYLPTPEPAADCVPSMMQPSGIGQLLVVRQQLTGYERVEISHIENVLEGETRTRDHNRRITTEETFLFEQITERTEERDLETTDRFELSAEAERTSKEDSEFKGELNVSGKYGPSVEFEASTSLKVNKSKEKSQKTAQKFSSEVVEKSVNKISERVREQRTLRIVEEVEELNHHGFVNDDPGHIIGIYQWLDKIYEAQIYDYGMRTLYDFVVPEPAAFLIAAFQAKHRQSDSRLQKPKEFTRDPDQITETNYTEYVDEYGAKDVQAPPALYESTAKSFQNVKTDSWKKNRYAEIDVLDIPNDYEAIYAYMTCTVSGDSQSAVDLHIDRSWYRLEFNGPTVDSTPMNNQRGKIPVGARAFRAESFVATIEVKCRRTEQAMDQWRLDTHEKIKTAYEQKLAEYYAEQDKLALESVEELSGGNPAANKKVAETELKRAAITMLANQRLLIDAMNIDVDDIPYIDIPAARAADPLIRFLEQAFEWENMNYLYYPYFWGRKEPHWKEKVLFEDVDDNFAQFVKAGAARVQLAVRPGFEDAVDHYLKTCEPWNGGELPTIGDPLYVPFADERKAQLGAPGDEVPFGDPWEVRVPTSLVILREDSKLPEWEKVGDEWVEVEEGANGNGDGGNE